MKKLSLLLFFVNALSFSQTAADYYKKAQESFENMGPSLYAKEYVDNAIKIDSTNTDYRWLRVKCNLVESINIEQYYQAINDIKYIISTGKQTGQLYANLGVAYFEAGRISAMKKAKQSTGFEDKNTNQDKEQREYFKEAIKNYDLASKAFKKAAEINPDKKDKYLDRAKASDYEINQLNKRML